MVTVCWSMKLLISPSINFSQVYYNRHPPKMLHLSPMWIESRLFGNCLICIARRAFWETVVLDVAPSCLAVKETVPFYPREKSVYFFKQKDS